MQGKKRQREIRVQELMFSETTLHVYNLQS